MRQWLRKPVKFNWPVMHMLILNDLNPPLSPLSVNLVLFKNIYVPGRKNAKM